MNCAVCKKRGYVPRRMNTMGEVIPYLTARGWTIFKEEWYSSHGRSRTEETFYCPKCRP